MKAFVYILTNSSHTVLYTGVTNNLARRVNEHANKVGSEFTRLYNVNKLVFYECFDSIVDAIEFEKLVKRRSRKWKIKLIEQRNPTWSSYSNACLS